MSLVGSLRGVPGSPEPCNSNSNSICTPTNPCPRLSWSVHGHGLVLVTVRAPHTPCPSVRLCPAPSPILCTGVLPLAQPTHTHLVIVLLNSPTCLMPLMRRHVLGRSATIDASWTVTPAHLQAHDKCTCHAVSVSFESTKPFALGWAATATTIWTVTPAHLQEQGIKTTTSET